MIKNHRVRWAGGLQAIAVIALTATLAIAQGGAQQPWPTKQWPAAKLNDVGVDPAPLDAFDAELSAVKHGYVDSLRLFRCGKLVYEKTYARDYGKIYGEQAKTPGPLNHDPSGLYNYYNAAIHPYYRGSELHTMQSVTKTVTSVTIGVAIARGDFPAIDTPMLKFFDVAKVANVDERKRRITLRHLLTMTAGMEWHEDLPYNDARNSADIMEASKDWVQYAVDQPMAEEPGARFNYSSGSSQILSHIFKKAAGKDINDYAAEHLFKPMGITHYWKRSPTGLSDTEGGLYLRAQDLAKIGYLFLQNGKWEGKQLLSAEWVKESVAPQTTVGNGPVKYGYKWWLHPYREGKLVWAGSGFGGQRLFVVPEHDLVLVYTGWNILTPPLGNREALQRVLAAVKPHTCATP